MEEANDQPPHMILIDPWLVVYQGRRRKLISGKPPPGLPCERPVTARDWQAYINRMSEEPPWERAWRYRLMMSHQGFKSIRALALAIREDHSRVARVLQILKLPASVLAALRTHADRPRIRAYFTEKRLRQLVRESRSETDILREIEQVLQEPCLKPGLRSRALLASRRLVPVPGISADGGEPQGIPTEHEMLHR